MHPVHGGNLRWAAEQFNIPHSEWLDLSTGINPDGWPVPLLSSNCWQRLPEEGDGLEDAAHHYYGSELSLPVAGSQAAISKLPTLRKVSRVGIITPGYVEHARAWHGAGHEVIALDAKDIDEHLPELDVLVIINPNNPTGEVFTKERLQNWWQKLRARGGWLVIDEAFIDSTPELSMIPNIGGEGLVVLRSLGKFFGLAGVRVGFVFAWRELLSRLKDEMDPWSVNGPAREVARRALEDRVWQRKTGNALKERGEQLSEILGSHGLRPSGGTSLFQYCVTGNAEKVFHALGEQGVLVRKFADPCALRFGLPGVSDCSSEQCWHRLDSALSNIDLLG